MSANDVFTIVGLLLLGVVVVSFIIFVLSVFCILITRNDEKKCKAKKRLKKSLVVFVFSIIVFIVCVLNTPNKVETRPDNSAGITEAKQDTTNGAEEDYSTVASNDSVSGKTTSESKSKPQTTDKTHVIGDTVSYGDIEVTVLSYAFSDKLSNGKSADPECKWCVVRVQAFNPTSKSHKMTNSVLGITNLLYHFQLNYIDEYHYLSTFAKSKSFFQSYDSILPLGTISGDVCFQIPKTVASDKAGSLTISFAENKTRPKIPPIIWTLR